MLKFAFKYSHYLTFLTNSNCCKARGLGGGLSLSNQLVQYFSSRPVSAFTLRSNFITKSRTTVSNWRYISVNPVVLIMSSGGSPPRSNEASPRSNEASPRSSEASPRSQSSPQTSPRPLPEDVKADKDKFLNMDLEKKRALYKCGDEWVTLDNILTWEEYYTQHKMEPANAEEKKFDVNKELNSKVSLFEGDITALEIDSIVNAANNSLLGGGGVDGAIHRAAGAKLLKECRVLKGCPDGHAKITGGYKLPSKYVIATVGPTSQKPDVLRSCYANSLQLMVDNELRSTAFPCIATGVYGYPRDKAAHVALRTTREFLEKNSDKVDRVIFTVFLPEDKEVYEELLPKYFPLE